MSLGSSRALKLSKEHGLNPAIPKCFLCNEDKNEILLLGRLPNDVEAPRGKVWDKEPCDKCKEYMEKGVILISVDESKSKGDMGNPYRTGGWCVLKVNAIKRIGIMPKSLEEDILKQRIAFIPDTAWDHLGLPRGEVEGVPNR